MREEGRKEHGGLDYKKKTEEGNATKKASTTADDKLVQQVALIMIHVLLNTKQTSVVQDSYTS